MLHRISATLVGLGTAVCLASAGCQLIAYGEDDGAGLGGTAATGSASHTGTTSTSTPTTSTGPGDCPAPFGVTTLQCSPKCSDFCVDEYRGECSADVDAFKGKASCCVACKGYGGPSIVANTVVCRENKLSTQSPPDSCSAAGPFGECGVALANAVAIYNEVCDGNVPLTLTNLSMGIANLILDAASTRYFGCNGAADCLCDAIGSGADGSACEAASTHCHDVCGY